MTRDEMTLALFSDAWLGRAFENNPGVLECKFLSQGEILEYQNLKGTYSPRLALPRTHKDPEAQGPEVGSPRQHPNTVLLPSGPLGMEEVCPAC